MYESLEAAYENVKARRRRYSRQVEKESPKEDGEFIDASLVTLPAATKQENHD